MNVTMSARNLEFESDVRRDNGFAIRFSSFTTVPNEGTWIVVSFHFNNMGALFFGDDVVLSIVFALFHYDRHRPSLHVNNASRQ